MGPVMDTDLVHLGTLLCIWYCEVMDPVIGVSTAGAPCFPTFLVVTLLPEAAVTRLLLDLRMLLHLGWAHFIPEETNKQNWG